MSEVLERSVRRFEFAVSCLQSDHVNRRDVLEAERLFREVGALIPNIENMPEYSRVLSNFEKADRGILMFKWINKKAIKEIVSDAGKLIGEAEKFLVNLRKREGETKKLNTQVGLIKCKKCGSEMPSTAKFCGKCGTKI